MEVILIQDVDNLGSAHEKVSVKNGYARNYLIPRKLAIEANPLKVGAKTGTSGKIFGSVTSVQLARAIRAQKGYEIDRRRIHILDEVKELGTYKAKVDFGNSNETEVEFEVTAE